MPYSGTPEEIRAKRHAKHMSTYPQRRAQILAQQQAAVAAMTPEELAAYQERRLAAVRRYEQRHRDKRYGRKKNPRYRAQAAASKRAKHAENPEHVRALSRALYAKDPARGVAYVRAYAKRYPQRVYAVAQARRARIKNAPRNDVTGEQRELVLEAAKGRCVYCPHYNPRCRRCPKGLHTDLQVDHISPVGPEGPNTLHNLVACCRSCNPKKRRKPNPVPVQPLLL